ncbi:hypothetical protein TYRP_001079 [Tyrophagus putrescentiae]|nr:hypothetical protein TYRP_001079 [Tyrophagus putrescentiae]
MVSQTSNSGGGGHLFTSNCVKCLAALGLLLLLVSPVHSRALHKRHQQPSSAENSFDEGTSPSDDSSGGGGESKMPASWHALRRASSNSHRHHRHQHNHHVAGKQSHHSAEETDVAAEEVKFTQEVLGASAAAADNTVSSSVDNADDSVGDEAAASIISRQQSGGHAQTTITTNNNDVDVLSEEGVQKTADSLRAIADKSREQAKVAAAEEQAKLDTLILEINEESQKERAANQMDNSFQQAEAVKAKLDFEINRTRLILMRLRSLQRNVADAHFLAKKLVESDVVSKTIKDDALTNLDKSVEMVKKVLVKIQHTMLTYIPSVEALERFKAEVKREEANLLSGKCQLCIDALLFLTPIQASDESMTTSMRVLDELSPNYTVVPPIILSGDEYLREIISRCPCVKIVCPSSIPFNGYVDLSPLESCIALELVRIPFSRLTGISGLRNRLRSLIWIRGYKDDEPSDEPSSNSSSIFTSFSYNPHTLKGNLKIDEIFWDQFGTWPLLSYLCISQSNISHINASFPAQCQSVLYQLATFNGKSVKRTVRRARGTISDSSLLPVANIDAALQASTSSANRYGTFLREDINDSLQTNRTSDLDESFRSKAKASKERFVVINEQGDEEGVVTLPAAYNPNTAGPSTRVTIEIQAEVNPLLSGGGKSKKNYLFGGVSGSYGSFQPLLTTGGETAAGVVDVSGSLEKSSHHLTDEAVIQAEKSKLLQKREKLGDDWLLSGQSTPAVLMDNAILLGINEQRSETTTCTQEGEVAATASQEEKETEKQPETTTTTPKPMPVTSSSSNLDETCEWDDEDTEDENTVFLVEIYPNEGEFLSSVNSSSEASGDYFFIRVRPRDGLLFEKDCTTGKVLTTLDLKILEHYQCLPRDVPEAEARALRLIFDTTITSKRERVYVFVEDGQCEAFTRLYLASYGQYKSKFEADLLAQCHSDLIIKDNSGSRSSNGLDFQSSGNHHHRASTPLQSSPKSSNCLEASEEMFSSGAFSQNNDPMLSVGGGGGQRLTAKHDSSSVVSEENLDSEPSTIDETFFKADIDHYLKLHIEIYIYEQIDDTELKGESIESVAHCMALDFATNNLSPALVVFTQNYLFVFDHLVVVESSNSNSRHQPAEESQVRLRFYRQLAGPKASPFIISHLPAPLKNQGYWIECGPCRKSGESSSSSKESKKKRSKRRKRSKGNLLSEYALELLLFDDKAIGKAFLQLFLHSHRSCFRVLGETANGAQQQQQLQQLEANLVLIKADITELSHVDEERDVTEEATALMKRRNRVALHFDEACQRLLREEQKEAAGKVPDAYSSLPAQVNSSSSSIESANFFLVRSFNLISNISAVTGRGTHSPLSSAKDNSGGAFKVQQNLALIVSQGGSLVICQLVARLGAIAALTASLRPGQSMAQALQSTARFEDSIEVRLLIKDLIVNLLPNVYIDRAEMMLVLRFRDEDNGSSNVAGHWPTTPNSSSEHHGPDCVNTLKRACRLIQSLWEENFGVSLTLSKHVPLSA